MFTKLASTYGILVPLIFAVLALLLTVSNSMQALSQSLDQWKPTSKSLANCLASDYRVQAIVVMRVSPVSTDASLLLD